MQHYTDRVLYKTHQHFVVVLIKCFYASIPCFVLFVLLSFFFPEKILISFIVLTLIFLSIVALYYFFWIKSYFIITNEKVVVKVRNGLFSKFHMNIYFKNVRDAAFSKNHLLHYMFDYGTLFLRSSAGAVGDLEAKNIPHIERVYKIVNFLHNISEEERRSIQNFEDIQSNTPSPFEHFPSERGRKNSSLQGEGQYSSETRGRGGSTETLSEATQKEKEILLNIQGIKEVVELTDADRRYIFEHEEDRNHGVYECLRRQVLFAATHDSTLREPDEAIVMKSGEKVVFPVVEFHEIKRKKVSSSSPGLDVHHYLEPKFENFGEYDATLLIGFDM